MNSPEKNNVSVSGKLYNYIINNKPWPKIIRKKKHKLIDHCQNFFENHSSFQKNWRDVSGIYKRTFLPCRLFYYYGSSRNLGQRFKYHYYNGPTQMSFLGIFLKRYGWEKF
uniref:GIY-YIG endonuclease n=1 Tax=Ramaria cf. rubripermanens TaxID=2016387 RepID=UPI0022372396|nr:GIY-YIG endonuclease [Ramaria cf. rubripermanens]UYR22188.1 GIY-YIG endonuclease [Ramaria cf. rubripermanens]